MIGSIYAQKYPEDVKCYISISQITNLYENKLDIARSALEQKEINGTKDEEELQELPQRTFYVDWTDKIF